MTAIIDKMRILPSQRWNDWNLSLNYEVALAL